MPIRRSPNGAVTSVHSLVPIAGNGWSRSIGTGQSVGPRERNHPGRASFHRLPKFMFHFVELF
jgi:hypothetical protein